MSIFDYHQPFIESTRIAERPAPTREEYESVLSEMYVATVDRDGRRIREKDARTTIHTLLRMMP